MELDDILDLRYLREEVRRLRAELERAQKDLEGAESQKADCASEIARLGRQVIAAQAPPVIYYTKGGQCYRKAACNHLKHEADPKPRA
eukprot:Skav216618  [mRNA]  locus=scaffold2940:183638:183901:+ [translate_table: standard]